MPRSRWCSRACGSRVPTRPSTCTSRAGASRRSCRPVLGGRGAGSARARHRRVDLDGGFLVPGLHDRHVHLSQWAMVSRRLDLAGADSAAAVAAIVAASVDRGEPEVIGFGYRDGLWPDAPTRAAPRRRLGRRPGRARRRRPARLLAEHRRGPTARRGRRGGGERRAARGRLLPPRARARRRGRRGARRVGRRRRGARRRAGRGGRDRLRDAVEPRRLGAARRRRHPLAARLVRRLHPAPRPRDRRGPAHRRRRAGRPTDS